MDNEKCGVHNCPHTSTIKINIGLNNYIYLCDRCNQKYCKPTDQGLVNENFVPLCSVSFHTEEEKEK